MWQIKENKFWLDGDWEKPLYDSLVASIVKIKKVKKALFFYD